MEMHSLKEVYRMVQNDIPKYIEKNNDIGHFYFCKDRIIKIENEDMLLLYKRGCYDVLDYINSYVEEALLKDILFDELLKKGKEK